VLEHLSQFNCQSTLDFRKTLAIEAFAETSNYDSLIFNEFNKHEGLPHLRISQNQQYPLRYGENPHQEGSFWGDFDEMFEKLNGKHLSYNNLLDVDAALNMIADFDDCTFIIIKHHITHLTPFHFPFKRILTLFIFEYSTIRVVMTSHLLYNLAIF
jgi:phosphoribosylaminoimidazolecarboxamide formyltransferase/IMP cyclohydrolase